MKAVVIRDLGFKDGDPQLDCLVNSLIGPEAHPRDIQLFLLAGLRCEVFERSAAGGVVEVYTDESPAPEWFPDGNRPQIVWQPPPAPDSPKLVVKYLGATLRGMGNDPSGGHIRFRVSPPDAADDTQVILSLRGSEDVTLQGEDLGYGRDYGSDDESRPVMDVTFAPAWSKVRSAIVGGGQLGVKLVRHGRTMTATTFDFSNRKARDALLAQARRKVEARNPRVCANAPRPIERMF